MTQARDSSDVVRWCPAKRARALNFADRSRFPIW